MAFNDFDYICYMEVYGGECRSSQVSSLGKHIYPSFPSKARTLRYCNNNNIYLLRLLSPIVSKTQSKN